MNKGDLVAIGNKVYKKHKRRLALIFVFKRD